MSFLSSLPPLLLSSTLFVFTVVFHTCFLSDLHAPFRNTKYYNSLSYAEKKLVRYYEKLPLLMMKKPMYDNIPMLDCEGNYLSTIAKKKADWYVKKNLAVNVTVDGRRGLRLTFVPNALKKSSPSGQPPSESAVSPLAFSRLEKKNECVVCGTADAGFMRHYIVPSAYRSRFPSSFKSHMSHDICILCPDCHLRCQSIYGKEMTILERKALAMVCADRRERYIVDRPRSKVRNEANAILKHCTQIPHDVLELHRQKVREYLTTVEGGTGEITRAALERLSELECTVENEKWKSGPVLIVEGLNNDPGRITDFVRAWRKFFVASMNPRHLSPSWSIDSSANNHREVDVKGTIDEILSGAKLSV